LRIYLDSCALSRPYDEYLNNEIAPSMLSTDPETIKAYEEAIPTRRFTGWPECSHPVRIPYTWHVE